MNWARSTSLYSLCIIQFSFSISECDAARWQPWKYFQPILVLGASYLVNHCLFKSIQFKVLLFVLYSESTGHEELLTLLHWSSCLFLMPREQLDCSEQILSICCPIVMVTSHKLLPLFDIRNRESPRTPWQISMTYLNFPFLDFSTEAHFGIGRAQILFIAQNSETNCSHFQMSLGFAQVAERAKVNFKGNSCPALLLPSKPASILQFIVNFIFSHCIDANLYKREVS